MPDPDPLLYVFGYTASETEEPSPEDFGTPEPYGEPGLVKFRRIGGYIFVGVVLLCAAIFGLVLFMNPQ